MIASSFTKKSRPAGAFFIRIPGVHPPPLRGAARETTGSGGSQRERAAPIGGFAALVLAVFVLLGCVSRTDGVFVAGDMGGAPGVGSNLPPGRKVPPPPDVKSLPPPGEGRGAPFVLTSGRAYRLFCVDLTAAALAAWPPAGEVGADGLFSGKTVSSFARDSGAFLAVNMTPFDTPAGPLGSLRRNVGVFINDGVIVSPGVPKYAAFTIDKSGIAGVSFSQGDGFPSAEDLGTAGYAFGGFFQILRGGEVVEEWWNDSALRDERTAIGVSAGGDKVYVLVARKFTHRDCAELLRDAGSSAAIAMDGGNSSCVVYGGKKFPPGFVLRGVGSILGFVGH